jgi:DNA-directed RNA polymerase subunit M/transcription elongation factor TFIIS
LSPILLGRDPLILVLWRGSDEGRVMEAAVTNQNTSFSGKCPKCHGYNSRIRTEVINYSQEDPPAELGQQAVVSRTRIFLCNSCQHVWSETIPG